MMGKTAYAPRTIHYIRNNRKTNKKSKQYEKFMNQPLHPKIHTDMFVTQFTHQIQ